MSSLALLVDADERLRPVLERHLGGDWHVLLEADVEQAFQRGPFAHDGRGPDLVVLNVDVPKGWSLCTQVKKRYQSVPVIIVSYRLGKDVFNNHQKLESRADAYHRLPDEMDSLEITLGYFSSHRSETDTEATPETGETQRPEPRPRSGQRASVQSGPRASPAPTAPTGPSSIMVKLESTVGEQARELENLRRQIEALEAERDAMADKSRRQMMDLMALAPSSADASGESKALKARIGELEAEVLLASRREDEVRELRREVDRLKHAPPPPVPTKNDKPAKDERNERVAELEKQLARAAGDLKAAQETLWENERHGLEDRHVLEAKLGALQAEKANWLRTHATHSAADPSMVAELEVAREAARKEASDAAVQLAQASTQMTNLATELAVTRRARLAAEAALKAAEERSLKNDASKQLHSDGRIAELEALLAEAVQRAETAERAWSSVNARAESQTAALTAKTVEVDKLAKEKTEAETALNTSRKLIREYAAEAARRTDDLRALEVKHKELEQRLEQTEAARGTAAQSADFEHSLAASLEKELTVARAAAEEAATKLSELSALRLELGDRTTVHKALEASFAKLRTSAVAHTEILVSRVKDLSAWGRALEARLAEIEAGRVAARAKLDLALTDLRGGTHAIPPKPLVDAPVLPDFSKV